MNTHPNGYVGHQYTDFIYFARVDSRDITPAAGEVNASEWSWYTRHDLATSDFDPDTIQMGFEAIEMIEDT